MRVGTGTRITLRVVALGYLFVLVAVPIGVILWRAFEPGLGTFIASITTPAAISALNLSLLIVAIVVPLNVVFGVVTALALVRGRFRGRGLLQAVVDLPFAVSPIVVGVALIMLWGVDGWFGAHRPGRLPGHLRAARHGAGDDLRHAALRRARGRAGAPRDRHGAGAGRLHARRRPVADVLAHHPSGDPLGPDLRRRAHRRPRARRVRRGHHGVAPASPASRRR